MSRFQKKSGSVRKRASQRHHAPPRAGSAQYESGGTLGSMVGAFRHAAGVSTTKSGARWVPWVIASLLAVAAALAAWRYLH